MFCKSYVCSLKTNDLSNQLYGEKLLPYHKPPAKYIGELFGIQYLYQQSIPELPHTDKLSNDADLEDEDKVDEGLGDEFSFSLPSPFPKIYLHLVHQWKTVSTMRYTTCVHTCMHVCVSVCLWCVLKAFVLCHLCYRIHVREVGMKLRTTVMVTMAVMVTTMTITMMLGVKAQRQLMLGKFLAGGRLTHRQEL